MNRTPSERAPIGLQPPSVADASLGAHFKVFNFSDSDFRRLRKMIFDYAGISLNDNKKPMAYSRLTKRLRQLGLSNFGEYLDFVEASGSEEHVRFINALTTNLTYFFREAHHFTILSEHLLKLQGSEPLTIWSAACSTGEEPYSIAMAAIEAFGSDAPPVRIIASDLDTDALAAAERGVYASEKVASLSPQRLKRFFLKGTGDQAGFARIRPQVQRLVEFRQVNLHEADWNMESTGPLAAIFCRNVMIYFNKETQTRVLDRFAPLLRKDGLLFAGHSENFFYNGRDTFRIRGKTVYELTTEAA
jgi:chemotaxis protein methyltransferase CheR